MNNRQAKIGYYAVTIAAGFEKIPYVVFATSDFQAARIVYAETGYMPTQYDVEGPYQSW